MGNNTSENKKNGSPEAQNIYNAVQPIAPRGTSSASSTAEKKKQKKAKEEEEKKKKEVQIPIDKLCQRKTDPFYDNISIDSAKDEFMRRQHEIELSEIAGYGEHKSSSEYECCSWKQSKDFVCCKLYYNQKDFEKKSKTGLLIWCRAAKLSNNADLKDENRFIEVNMIELRLHDLRFDPSDIESYRLKKQYIIPLMHANKTQRRLKTQLHPRRPLLFTFSRQSVNQGTTSLELFNFENDGKKLRFDNDSFVQPNAVYSFASDYYLNNEQLEQNDLHFVHKIVNNVHHEYVLLFHKPEIEQNMSSGSKLVVFDLTNKNMNNFKQQQQQHNAYATYNNYNANSNRGVSLNFNTLIWNTLHVGQTYHHNLIDIHSRGVKDQRILILFRIHHVKLINQDNRAAPPQSLGQLDPNSNFNFESWSQIYYVDLDLTMTNQQLQLKDITKFGFKSLPLSKTSVKESNCVDTVKFSVDGEFFAIIKQREHNDEALFRVYRTGETDKNAYLCQMTNIDIKPWMIELRAHDSTKYGHFFSISHVNDDIEKSWMILAGPNIHGDLQTFRDILREWLYDDAISVVVSMIGLSHRYTLHFDIGDLAGEQMASFDYNKYLDTMFFAIDDATYMLFQTN